MLPVRRDNSLPARARRSSRRLRSTALSFVPVRRKASTPRGSSDAPRSCCPPPRSSTSRGRERSRPSRRARPCLRVLLRPILDYYTRRRTSGRDKLSRLKAPVILVANHVSHLDTPVILAALPRRVSQAHGRRPRRPTTSTATGSSRSSSRSSSTPCRWTGRAAASRSESAGHVDRLLDRGWNLLLYPEGTRSRQGAHRSPAPRRGGPRGAPPRADHPDPRHRNSRRDAAGPLLAVATSQPRRLQAPPVSISFGDPITPTEDVHAVIRTVQRFFDEVEEPRRALALIAGVGG